jgi:hypothetical protein
MLHVQCPGCGTSAYIDCIPGCDQVVGAHIAGCPMSDPAASITCRADSDCCKTDHDHQAAADNCPADHSDHPCPDEPGKCGVHLGMQMWAHDEDTLPDHLQGDCPGGHHGLGVQDCSVCRPLVITVPPGSTVIQAVGG